MAAKLMIETKREFSDGAIIQIRVWSVPDPVPGSSHRLKYSLFYGFPGQRVVGFDNERGKGDHRHLDGVECTYRFVSTERLVRDFLSEVRRRRVSGD